MRWFEREFADYERMMKEETGKSSLDQLNEIGEKIAPGCDGVIFLPYMAGERSPIWNPACQRCILRSGLFEDKGAYAESLHGGVAFPAP
ncbi:MAG: hypothetical protein ACLUTA_14540 [Blautia wexlerae]